MNDLDILARAALAVAARVFGEPAVKVTVQTATGQTLAVRVPARLPPQIADDARPSEGYLVPGVRASRDCRCMNFHGTVFSFTEQQSAVVRLLANALKQGTPDLADKTVLRAVDSDATRIVDIFRDHPAWNVAIVEGGSRGTHRLADKPAV